MARNKEFLLLLLDVSPSMHRVLPVIEKVCSMLVKKKMIYSKYDEVGIVLFGTTETGNELTMELGGYKHVMVLKNIKVVDGDTVEALQQLPRGTTDGDFLDAVIVGVDMLIKNFGYTYKGKKRLCLITNSHSPIKDAFEGTKEDQVTKIAKQMAAFGIRLENIIAWVYKKTAEEKFPTLRKYSDRAPTNDIPASHEVKVDIGYKSFEDSKKVIPPGQRIKGYRYGPQIVPISSAVWEAVKFKPEKGVKLLGFTDSSNILRHRYMKDAYVFIAEPRNTKATLAVSAIARAMKEMNKVAILQCVWRQGQGKVIIGVLTPNISDRENIPDSFYFNVRPFADDMREFQFPSFSKLPEFWQPNEQQIEATDNLVKMLDLAPDGKEEVLLPDFTTNPILERFYHHLELKSKHPDAAVPPLDDTLKKITVPDEDLLLQNKSVIDSFRMAFFHE